MANKKETVREAAKAAGVSPGLLSRKRAQGKSDAQIAAEAASRAERQAARGVGKGVVSFSEAQRRKEQALAELRELELATKRGELVATADVQREWTGVLAAVRDSMLALPMRLSGRLAAMTDQRVIERFLRDAIRAELTKLSDAFAETESG